MANIRIKRFKIDRSSKKVQEYENAFKRGFDNLSPEQKKIVEEPTINDPKILKALQKNKSLTSKLRSFLGLK
jgi:hypothetical protein